MKFDFTAGELERLQEFADNRAKNYYTEWDFRLFDKLQGYIRQAKAFEESEG